LEISKEKNKVDFDSRLDGKAKETISSRTSCGLVSQSRNISQKKCSKRFPLTWTVYIVER